MADLDINITVSGGETDETSTQAAGNNTDTAKGNARTAARVSYAMQVAERFASQITTNVVGSIGTFSGNNVLQTRVEQGISVVSKLAGVGVAFAANPIVGAVALAGEAVNTAFQFAKNERQREWQNAEAAELRRRAGYLSKGNRGQ